MTIPQRLHRPLPHLAPGLRPKPRRTEPEEQSATTAGLTPIAAGRAPSPTFLPPRLISPTAILQLQRIHGNRHVQRLVAQWTIASAAASLQRELEDEGATGAGPVEGVPVREEAEAAAPDLSNVNEDGEIDGTVTSGVVPHVFVNGGKKGSGIVHWVGGNGGSGLQDVAEIDLVAPVYENKDPTGKQTHGRGWIRAGTGKAKVKRSYRGVVVGPNGPTAYFTRRASARADAHEKLHVASSKTHHDANIKPLETRVSKHRMKPWAMKSGTTGAAAETALKTFVDWSTAIAAFTTADSADNTPMGTVDAADLAKPDFIRDYGPRTVKGVNYAHYYDVPPGP